ncbi:MAG: L-erythro-3,5-diaminohexanoate dehydrogenase, partial [Bradymonadaceae bacterium]
MEFRAPCDRYGVHRVLEPQGALPQGAERLDPSAPPYRNELVLDVEWLNVDSASFRQLFEAGGGTAEGVGEQIVEIVEPRGKLENPVTGSGGMLLGTVAAVGPAYDGPVDLAVGDRVATLVSLTLTPLDLNRVLDVDLDSHQVEVDARAYLWPTSPVAVMPDDVGERTALSV